MSLHPCFAFWRGKKMVELIRIFVFRSDSLIRPFITFRMEWIRVVEGQRSLVERGKGRIRYCLRRWRMLRWVERGTIGACIPVKDRLSNFASWFCWLDPLFNKSIRSIFQVFPSWFSCNNFHESKYEIYHHTIQASKNVDSTIPNRSSASSPKLLCVCVLKRLAADEAERWRINRWNGSI